MCSLLQCSVLLMNSSLSRKDQIVLMTVIHFHLPIALQSSARHIVDNTLVYKSNTLVKYKIAVSAIDFFHGLVFGIYKYFHATQ